MSEIHVTCVHNIAENKFTVLFLSSFQKPIKMLCTYILQSEIKIFVQGLSLITQFHEEQYESKLYKQKTTEI